MWLGFFSWKAANAVGNIHSDQAKLKPVDTNPARFSTIATRDCPYLRNIHKVDEAESACHTHLSPCYFNS